MTTCCARTHNELICTLHTSFGPSSTRACAPHLNHSRQRLSASRLLLVALTAGGIFLVLSKFTLFLIIPTYRSWLWL